jgi:hypothetical protein
MDRRLKLRHLRDGAPPVAAGRPDVRVARDAPGDDAAREQVHRHGAKVVPVGLKDEPG